MTPARRRELVDRRYGRLSVVRQCQLLGVSRSSFYYRAQGTSPQDLTLMRELDRQYLETPFYGSRRMKACLERQGKPASRKRVQRLMRLMGLRAIYRRPRTSRPAPEQRVYPYLLREASITRPNQVWAADITYLPMARGFLYLVAVMDWHSRYVLAWRLSNTLEAGFCAEALTEALGCGRPEVFNTDQGSQFTSREFTQILQDHSVKISMDGRGRYQDNIFVERLWRTLKYEEVYLKTYANATEARRELGEYFRFYNNRRPASGPGLPDAGGGLLRRACSRGVEREEVFGPTGLAIIRGSAGVPLNCGLILSNQWGPPHSWGPTGFCLPSDTYSETPVTHGKIPDFLKSANHYHLDAIQWTTPPTITGDTMQFAGKSSPGLVRLTWQEGYCSQFHLYELDERGYHYIDNISPSLPSGRFWTDPVTAEVTSQRTEGRWDF